MVAPIVRDVDIRLPRSGAAGSQVAPSQAILQCFTGRHSTSCTAVVEYGLTTSYGNTTAPTAAGGVHHLTLSGLLPGSTYHARVVATDPTDAANPTTTQDYSWLQPPDGLVTGSAPVPIGAGAPQEATTGAVTVPWPTGHQAGDIGLLFVERAGGSVTPTLTTAAGFVELAGTLQTTGTTTLGTKIDVFWCRATSASQASPVVAASADHQYAVLLAFRGCLASGPPYDVGAGGVKAAASTTVLTAGMTTAVPNSLVVEAVARDTAAAGAAFSALANGALVGLTEHVDAGTILGGGGGLAVWSGTKVAAGGLAGTTATVASSINAFSTLALRPQP